MNSDDKGRPGLPKFKDIKNAIFVSEENHNFQIKHRNDASIIKDQEYNL
jgi:hypothetical protein